MGKMAAVARVFLLPMLLMLAFSTMLGLSTNRLRGEKLKLGRSMPTLRANEISALRARALVRQEGAILVDARSTSVFERRHIAGAQSLPANSFESSYPALADSLQGKTVITYCSKGCNKAAKLAYELEERGHRAVYIQGGIDAWSRHGLPTEGGRP